MWNEHGVAGVERKGQWSGRRCGSVGWMCGKLWSWRCYMGQIDWVWWPQPHKPRARYHSSESVSLPRLYHVTTITSHSPHLQPLSHHIHPPTGAFYSLGHSLKENLALHCLWMYSQAMESEVLFEWTDSRHLCLIRARWNLKWAYFHIIGIFCNTRKIHFLMWILHSILVSFLHFVRILQWNGLSHMNIIRKLLSSVLEFGMPIAYSVIFCVRNRPGMFC